MNINLNDFEPPVEVLKRHRFSVPAIRFGSANNGINTAAVRLLGITGDRAVIVRKGENQILLEFCEPGAPGFSGKLNSGSMLFAGRNICRLGTYKVERVDQDGRIFGLVKIPTESQP